MNQRTEPVTATITIESEGEAVFQRTFELAAGGRVDEETIGVEADWMRTVSVAIGEEGEYSGSWPDRSCRLHGIAIQPGGIEAGYLESVSGHSDAMHGCYAGNERDVLLEHEATERYDVTVTVVDHCAGSTWKTTMEADRFTDTTLDHQLTAGAIYTVAANVHGGGAATYRYEDECGDARVDIVEDGEVEIVAYRGTY